MAYLGYNKYKAKKKEIDGIVFDSKKEADRYVELKILEKAGAIENLEFQKSFLLIPKQYIEVNGKKKLAEREISYVADFVYDDKERGRVVEDTKGFRTKDYKIKRKLMLYIHGIRIREI